MYHLNQKLLTLNQYVAQLTQQATALKTVDLKVPPEALEALQVSLEELQVSYEELQQQNEELLETRETLERERQRYQSLFEFAPDGYLVTNLNGTIQEANRAAANLLHLPQKYLINKLLLTFIPPEQRQEFRAFLERLETVLAEPHARSLQWEGQLQPRQGELFEAALSVALTGDRPPETLTLRWLIRDITERKQMQIQLQQLNADLEQQVETRTAELEMALELQAAALSREALNREAAEMANRAKDEFLAVISHELRTPLNAILGWAQFLQRANLPPAVRTQAIETIERNARTQKNLIEDLLDLSRIVRGQLRLNLDNCNLHETLRAAIATLEPAIVAKQIQLITELDPNLTTLVADPERLQQIVWNLLSNAVKFTPPAGQVALRLTRMPGDIAQITVSDNGQGINPDFLPYLFNAFSQSAGIASRSHQGLGLGLAIARNLVELHGGTIEASSSGVGQGATFTVKLPLNRSLLPPLESLSPAPPCAPLAAGPPPPNWVPETPPLAKVRVLVVDDDPDSRDYFAIALETEGARVTTAGSATEAIAHLQQPGTPLPQVLISDIEMPEGNGYTLIHHIRQIEQLGEKQLPAVAITAYTRESDRKRVLAAGFQRHLAKPVELSELIATVIDLAPANPCI